MTRHFLLKVKANWQRTTYGLALSLVAAAAVVVSITLFASPAKAETTAVVESYASVGNVQPGMLVALVSGQSNTVQALTANNISDMFGAVVNPADTSAILSPSSGTQNTYVATNGDYDVLVSNQDGSIAAGDYITVSSLNGIGMKAGSTQSLVLGKALSGFNSNSTIVNTDSLVVNGKTTTVELGEIPVVIDIVRNPALNQVADLPGFLKHITQAVTNKPVDAARAYISLAILIITVIVVAVMLYSGISSSIISIGRNPLSKHSILSGLIGVSLTSIAIFIVGLFAVYLLLKL
ncbi:MAG TPA: hypothetical protein VMR95_02175 [Candidatus Binatia bacterium]|nr:hypothetical protein [Candidatus Binatia bacterium]